ncbi:ElaB Uncharacterized conserved protein [Oxalobacteraceae bacterium]
MFESKTTNADNELKALVRDAQALFDEATAAGGAKAEELRAQGMKMLDHAIAAAHDLQETAMRKGRKIAHDTDEYVHDNPWRAIGIAGVAGLLIGMLIAKR